MEYKYLVKYNMLIRMCEVCTIKYVKALGSVTSSSITGALLIDSAHLLTLLSLFNFGYFTLGTVSQGPSASCLDRHSDVC